MSLWGNKCMPFFGLIKYFFLHHHFKFKKCFGIMYHIVPTSDRTVLLFSMIIISKTTIRKKGFNPVSRLIWNLLKQWKVLQFLQTVLKQTRDECFCLLEFNLSAGTSCLLSLKFQVVYTGFIWKRETEIAGTIFSSCWLLSK